MKIQNFVTSAIFSVIYVVLFDLQYMVSDYSSLSFMIGIISTLFIAPVVEWFIHKKMYHDGIFKGIVFFDHIQKLHTIGHHKMYHPIEKFTSEEIKRIPIFISPMRSACKGFHNYLVYVFHILFYLLIGCFIWVPLWSFIQNDAFMLGHIFSSIGFINMSMFVHDTIHSPGLFPWIEKQPWYSIIHRMHWIHHVDHTCNFNIFLPFGDLMFQTIRTERTIEEGENFLRKEK